MLPSLIEVVVATAIVLALALAAVRLHAIDWAGALLGVVIALLAFVAGQVAWLATIVLFFVISSLFTRYRYEYKRKLGSAQEKGGTRSWPNTLANGGIAACASIAEIFTHSNIFSIVFLTSVAGAMSDTLATEIGLLSHSRPRLITNLKTFVSPGTSGGVTALGELVALMSSSAMAILGVVTMVVQTPRMELAVVAISSVIAGSMIGTIFDSFLGSTFQAVYKCTVCGVLTENASHHGKPTELIRGLRLLDNNSVNLVGIFVGATSSVLIYALFAPGTL
jgi:uncharacterized protein (TIGR00297 family)